MPVDKFGRISDTKTTDSGVSLTYINNNYVRSDGGTPLTGSLDMKGNIIYNVAEPVNPQDVATKVYVDNTRDRIYRDKKRFSTSGFTLTPPERTRSENGRHLYF